MFAEEFVKAQRSAGTFGDAAWPITAARLIRAEDGSLTIGLLMGDRRPRDGAALESLRERLHARGLPVGRIEYEEGEG